MGLPNAWRLFNQTQAAAQAEEAPSDAIAPAGEPPETPLPAPAPQPADDSRIPVNMASLSQLTTIKGIGKASADRIDAARKAAPITDLDDLLTRAALTQFNTEEERHALDAAIRYDDP